MAPANSAVQEEMRAAPKRPSRAAPLGRADVGGEGGEVDRFGLLANDAGEASLHSGPSFDEESSSFESSSSESSSEEEAPKEEPKKTYIPSGGTLDFGSESESSSEEESSSSESSSEEEVAAVAPVAPAAPKRLERGDGKRFADRWGENNELTGLKGPAVPKAAPEEAAPAAAKGRWKTEAEGASQVPLRPGETQYAKDGKTKKGRTHWAAAGTEGLRHGDGAFLGGQYGGADTEATHLPLAVQGNRKARTHYNTPEERAETGLTGNRGRLVPKVDQNLPVDTRGYGSKLSASGDGADKANFAVAGGGRGVYGMNPRWGEAEDDKNLIVSHHSSLLAGEDVVTAGEIKAERGRVKQVTNSSGHYKPEASTILPGLEAMEAEGIDVSMARIKAAGAPGENPDRAGPILAAQAGRAGMPHAEHSPLEARRAVLAELKATGGERKNAAEGKGTRQRARAVPGKVDTGQARAAAEQKLAAAATPEEREDATFVLNDVLEQGDWEKARADRAAKKR